MSAAVGGAAAELRDALKDAMERSGALRKLQAAARAEAYRALSSGEPQPPPQPSSETVLLNELVREYLIFNGLRETLSVFLPESGQPTARPFDRAFLAQQLNLQETPNTAQVPLLYALVGARRQEAPAGAPAQPQQPQQAPPHQQHHHAHERAPLGSAMAEGLASAGRGGGFGGGEESSQPQSTAWSQ
ncbi:flagellar basal body specific protein [Raphidocelis subcapitata]|uniref:Flagellar basal body specific protein n=1 Tax=Raphidocelis subcapitata TaxID=307507 RepID=A0A2V0NNJ9_9CHLO|nr:flagellar basal body specific protein [Raphidocelis subcapitata]|eukprot:GBF89148.1 flagellar basal body specific protein [Raphidocelis subcapitata]